MKKAKEIEAWDVLHNTLTEDSYTFGYVVNQLPFIKEAIRLDIPPDTYGKTVEEYHREMVKEALDIYATAEAEALDLIAKAKAEAARIVDQGEKLGAAAKRDLEKVGATIDILLERM
tara:strand:+ start:308 stop:658 length:351 start_codon:yes stop_codon:yes gene_type:complete